MDNCLVCSVNFRVDLREAPSFYIEHDNLGLGTFVPSHICAFKSLSHVSVDEQKSRSLASGQTYYQNVLSVPFLAIMFVG